MSFLSRLSQSAPEFEIDRIARNLQALLGTRKGCGSVLDDYGLGDYEAASNTADAVRILSGEIETLVHRYEPGLIEPHVTVLGRYGSAYFRLVLVGVVDGAEARFYIDVDTTYHQFTVSQESEPQ